MQDLTTDYTPLLSLFSITLPKGSYSSAHSEGGTRFHHKVIIEDTLKDNLTNYGRQGEAVDDVLLVSGLYDILEDIVSKIENNTVHEGQTRVYLPLDHEGFFNTVSEGVYLLLENDTLSAEVLYEIVDL